MTQIRYVNMPMITATLVSKRMATLHELQTVYGIKDAYDMLEVISVDAHNEYLARPK